MLLNSFDYKTMPFRYLFFYGLDRLDRVWYKPSCEPEAFFKPY